MAHAQKPDFVFPRNGRVHLNRWGASVQSTAGSRGVRISLSNAGQTTFEGGVRVLAPHSISQFPLHFPSRASPCATRFRTSSTPRWQSVKNLTLNPFKPCSLNPLPLFSWQLSWYRRNTRLSLFFLYSTCIINLTYSSLPLSFLSYQCNSCSFLFLSLRCRRLPLLAWNLSVTTLINILAFTPRSSPHPTTHRQFTNLSVGSVLLTLSETSITSNPPQHNLLNLLNLLLLVRILKLKRCSIGTSRQTAMEVRLSRDYLTLRRRNFLLNFSTPCI